MQPRGCGAGWAGALWLLYVCCCCCCLSFLLAPAESLNHLPAPHNQRIHLYNLEQVLSWDPVPINNLTSPVLYSVEYKFLTTSWRQVDCVHCTKIAEPICNFTAAGCFPPYFNVSLRIKAELGELVSDWALVPWFQLFRNATIGPPLDILVTSLDNSLIISFKPPFQLKSDKFHYYVYYWEKEGKQKVKGPVISQPIQLSDLKVSSEYCLQVQAELIPDHLEIRRQGLLSNISCHETSAGDSAKLQQTIIIILGIFALIILILSCYVLVRKFQGLIKHYFHSPPEIPSQIKEYLMDPNEPILEALDKNSSMEKDCWNSLSIVTCTEENQGVLSSNVNDNTCTDNQPSTKIT
ncbi:interferon gamma receptor 2 [Trichosurus vulpecula]|uniref:interferon gamma receptor 2 n=1 Tax=Trichosurus vulpecula TaxID=9337 RepID=UPI00186AF3A2|nr:interferon gamma receptor 2 [Trichosurus vulpecula]